MQIVRFLLLNGSMLCGYLLKGKEAYLPIRYLEILMFLKKTAWRMLHKIRKAMTGENDYYLEGEVRLMNHLQVEKMQTDIRIKKWRDARGEVLKTKFLFLD